MGRLALCLLGPVTFFSDVIAQEPRPPEGPVLPMPRSVAGGVRLENPSPEPDLRVLPINLATALHLAGSRPIDVELAAERVRGASAALALARAVWLPSVTIGGDYNRHDGKIQDSSGNVLDVSRSSVMAGAGSGIGSAAIFSLNEAMFGPL